MESLRTTFTQKLQAQWPATLEAWDALNKGGQMYHAGVIRDEHYTSAVSTIRLANDCNIPSILPTAFYWLSALLRVYGYRHDTVLAREDVERLVVGGQALNQVVLGAYSEMNIDTWTCQDTVSPCRECHLMVSLWWGNLLTDLAVQGPLEGLKYVMNEIKGSTTPILIGKKCRNVLIWRIEGLRRTIFDNLRMYFDLPLA
jgi:hypothetical protein